MKAKFLISQFGVLLLMLLLSSQNNPSEANTASDTTKTQNVTYEGSLKLAMILVPPGSFQRDYKAGNISVITKAFLMSQYEITREQFTIIMEADPSAVQYSTSTKDPVQSVNWYHAIAFCNKLSVKDGLTPVYSVPGIDFKNLTYNDIPDNYNTKSIWNSTEANWSANGYRLPTEMEWMWAAMGTPADGQNGGVNTTDYFKAFAGSTQTKSIGDYAVYGYQDTMKVFGQTKTGKTSPVGSKLPNELGLFDMSGNIWEWCWDLFDNYPAGTLTDYKGAVSGSTRIYRGGSWNYEAERCTIADRSGYGPSYQRSIIGFRVVKNK